MAEGKPWGFDLHFKVCTSVSFPASFLGDLHRGPPSAAQHKIRTQIGTVKYHRGSGGKQTPSGLPVWAPGSFWALLPPLPQEGRADAVTHSVSVNCARLRIFKD